VLTLEPLTGEPSNAAGIEPNTVVARIALAEIIANDDMPDGNISIGIGSALLQSALGNFDCAFVLKCLNDWDRDNCPCLAF
jgi:hypothetical protein